MMVLRLDASSLTFFGPRRRSSLKASKALEYPHERRYSETALLIAFVGVLLLSI